MVVCDVCNKEIAESDNGYAISIEQKDSTIRYDGCSVKCCANIFRHLADEWDNDSCNQC